MAPHTMKEEYREVTFTLPKPPSLNQFYAGKHFAVRQKYKKEYNEHIKEALSQIDPFHADTFKICMVHNTRYDCDNTILSIKFLSDYLKDNGYVTDDSKKYFKGLDIRVIRDGEDIEKDKVFIRLKLYGVTEQELQ